MTEQQNTFQDLNPRRLGSMNFIGLVTLVRKEVGRFTNVYIQTILAPMIMTLLFYTVFAVAFGGDARQIGNIPYMTFLVPGIVMMSMIQNAFSNTSSSLMVSKMQGNIVDILMPPLSPFEILLGYVAAGVIRGMLVGFACLVVILFFQPIHPHSLPFALCYGFLGTLFMSTMGVAAGLWAEKFEQLAVVTNFIVVPLTFLSGTFYSLHSLPDTWQAVAQMNPFFHLIDGFRYGITGHFEGNLYMGLGMLILYNFSLLIFTYAMILTGYKTRN